MCHKSFYRPGSIGHFKPTIRVTSINSIGASRVIGVTLLFSYLREHGIEPAATISDIIINTNNLILILMAVPKKTIDVENTAKAVDALKEVGYDVKNLVNDAINTKILGITRSAQIFNALDCINLAEKIYYYDMLRAVVNERLDKFFAESEKEL